MTVYARSSGCWWRISLTPQGTLTLLTYGPESEGWPTTTASRAEGGTLRPGELLSVHPPYCVAAEGQRSFRAIPTLDRLAFLASLAAQLRDVPDGTAVRLDIG